LRRGRANDAKLKLIDTFTLPLLAADYPSSERGSSSGIQTGVSEAAALATDRGQVRSSSISSYRDVRNGRQQLRDEGALVFAHRAIFLGKDFVTRSAQE
jgi:hypothetical protein